MVVMAVMGFCGGVDSSSEGFNVNNNNDDSDYGGGCSNGNDGIECNDTAFNLVVMIVVMVVVLATDTVVVENKLMLVKMRVI